MRDMRREFERDCRRAVAWKVLQVVVAVAAVAALVAGAVGCGPVPALADAHTPGIEARDGG